MAARGERLKEATTEAKRTIDAYREEKEKQFQDLVAKVMVTHKASLPVCLDTRIITNTS